MRRALLTALCACALLGALAAPAQGAFGLNNFQFKAEDKNGLDVTQAGSHPFAVKSSFGLNYTGTGIDALPFAQPRNIEFQLPPGFAGNPSAVPTCSHTDFLHLTDTGDSSCPDDTALGVIKAEILSPGPPAPRAVFNLENPPGTVAELGFVVVSELVTIDFYVQESPPYNVIGKVTNAPQAAELFGSELTIWGNPGDSAHDHERGKCVLKPSATCPAELKEEIPFITLPRACTGPLFTTYSALSWQGDEDHGSSTAPLETDGCEKLGFEPKIKSQPSTAAGESSSGLDFEVNVDDPELTNPSETAKADSDIKAIDLSFPPGVSVNPSAGEGQEACSSAQLAAETLTSQGCPEASKLGSVEVETPLLKDDVLGGSVYLAAQNDNPFNSLLALYVVIKDPALGILVRQPAKVSLDPATGQLSSIVSDLPQVPLSSVRLHFRTGPRAPLVTPSACGTYATEATLIPWASGVAPVKSSSSFTIDSNCSPKPLGPTFDAGTRANAASTYSPFDLRVTRADGEPQLTRFSATLPGGIVPKLAGVSECSDAAIAAARTKTGRGELAAPSCPASSLIGHVEAGAGVGSALTYVPGSVYLAGPFNGDPLSAVAIVPAIAGPLDVGNVVNRVALTLNQVTYLGEIDSAASEPFPTILAGIPLRLRDLRVGADRPDFTLNASGCEMKATEAQIFTAAGAFSASSPYRASGCGALGFNPKLALGLSGQMKRAGHPRLRSTLTYPYPSGPGYSNIAEAVVSLPPGLQIDNAHINNPCTRVQFNAGACPPKSILGTAKATSPLLDKPLQGPVYFRSNGGEHLLPDIVADLKGQVEIVVVGHVDATKAGKGNARIRTSFENVPDAPVTKFSLDLYGGKRGLLTNNRDLCKSSQKAELLLLGQNNKLRESTPKVKTSCKSGKGKRK